ncbi:D-aminoacyl-tRNA deacylase [Aliikangiella sp. IMCC44653]
MIALIQRVTSARVEVDAATIGQINAGLVALIGVVKGDELANADRLLKRLIGYRVFEDQQAKMNLSLADVHGGLLLVPQFTLAADTRSGRRPSFSSAAQPAEGEKLFNYLVNQAQRQYSPVQTGRFGADMQVSLCNNGPVTFWLEG